MKTLNDEQQVVNTRVVNTNTQSMQFIRVFVEIFSGKVRLRGTSVTRYHDKTLNDFPKSSDSNFFFFNKQKFVQIIFVNKFQSDLAVFISVILIKNTKL